MNPKDSINYSELPAHVDVDITAANIERAARKLRGGAGPSGLDAIHWQSFLLRYGKHSEGLREAMATVTRRLANSLVNLEDVRTLKVKWLTALDKCPGVRPIGVGECSDRVCGNVTIALSCNTQNGRMVNHSKYNQPKRNISLSLTFTRKTYSLVLSFCFLFLNSYTGNY